MTYLINRSSKANTYSDFNVATLSTEEVNTIRGIVLDAYKDFKEIDDILIDKFNTQLNVRVILKKNYSNELLVKLSKSQLIILEKLGVYLFNFDYGVKNFNYENKNEISILKNYAKLQNS